MSPEEKDAVMDRFRSGEIQVLVCTSVVEVGVDVPNATLMAIEGGDRFGLAQLHQLRGRISRGSFPGFCGVFADPQTDEAKQRLAAFTSTTDGFRLAETDFQLRGPGDLFGTRQHGLPPLRIADLLRDSAILDEARRDAQALVAADPGLSHPEHARLRRLVLALRPSARVGRRGVTWVRDFRAAGGMWNVGRTLYSTCHSPCHPLTPPATCRGTTARSTGLIADCWLVGALGVPMLRFSAPLLRTASV